MEADDSNDQYTAFPNLHIEGEIRQMSQKGMTTFHQYVF